MKNKILIMLCITLTLATFFAIPMSASIIPAPMANYSNVYTYSEGMPRIYGYFHGVQTMGTNIDDTTNLWTKQNSTKIGTNDIENVQRPLINCQMSAKRLDEINITFEATEALFDNSHNSNPSGYYRMRFGLWIRCYDSSYNSDVDIELWYEQGEAGLHEQMGKLTYIPTPSYVRGRYYYFDELVQYTSRYNSNNPDYIENIYFGITISAKEDTGVLFPGGEPYYQNAFIGLTGVYVEKYQATETEPPFQKGASITYGDSHLIFGDYQNVGDTFLNPFTQVEVTPYYNQMLFTNKSNPAFGYYYMPPSANFSQGWLYEVYIIPKELTIFKDCEIDHDYLASSSYDSGYQNGVVITQSINEVIQEGLEAEIFELSNELEYYKYEYELLLNSKDNYSDGYNYGYMNAMKSQEQLRYTLDSAGHLGRTLLHGVLDYGAYGITLQVVVVSAVILVITILILKKVK